MKIAKHLGIGAVLAVALSGGVAPASAAERWLEVRVVDRQSGAALENAAVCLGTSARPDQFGARRTGNGGAVRFEGLPLNSIELIAARRGYQGRRQTLEPLPGNRVVVVKLAPGGGGPVCRAPEQGAEAQAAPELEITDVQVARSPSASGEWLLSLRVSGEANQVRIAASADFKDAQWQPLQAENRFRAGSGAPVRQLYVQVRRHVQTDGASIEVVSPVRVAAVRGR